MRLMMSVEDEVKSRQCFASGRMTHAMVENTGEADAIR